MSDAGAAGLNEPAALTGKPMGTLPVGGRAALVGLVKPESAAVVSPPAGGRRPRLRLGADPAAAVLGSFLALRGHWGAGLIASLVFAAGYPSAVLLLVREPRPWEDGSMIDELRRLFAATALAAFVLLGVDAFLGHGGETTLAVRAWVFCLALLFVERVVIRRVDAASGAAGLRPVLIVGAGRVGADLARQLAKERRHRLKPVGFLDYAGCWQRREATQPLLDEDPARSLPLLGAPEELSDAVAQTGADCVAFAFTAGGDHRLVPLVQECERLGVTAFLVPRLFEAVGWRSRHRQVGQ